MSGAAPPGPGALRRVLHFILVGASGVLVNQFVLWGLREHVLAGLTDEGLRLNLALGGSIGVATVTNFRLHRAITWADRRGPDAGPWARFPAYLSTSALGIAVQVLLTNLLAARLYYLAANLIAIGVGSVANFILNHYWTFARPRPTVEPAREPAP